MTDDDLKRELANLGVNANPRDGWQQDVLDALPKPVLRESWWRRLLRWLSW